MGRRSSLTLLFNVLEVIERGENKPTRIMYSAKISWKVLRNALSILIASDFIREETQKNSKYFICDKGKRALLYYKRAKVGLENDNILEIFT